jgi:hypothetical protein
VDGGFLLLRHHEGMSRFLPRFTKVEMIFTLCALLSFLCEMSFIGVRFGLQADPGINRLFLDSWSGVTALMGIVGGVALIARGRALMIVPYLFVGYTLCVLSLLLMAPYSNVETLPQLIGAQFAICLSAYLFWFILLRIPLPFAWLWRLFIAAVREAYESFSRSHERNI